MADQLTNVQIIEFFHLGFLQVVQARLDQRHYVLKGGTNLRYFFASHRYSEDIDLDAVSIEPWRLEETIDRALDSPAMKMLLQSGGLAARDVTKPKQTNTTQRWKLLIDANGGRTAVRTKIEFSHRGSDPRRVLDAVPNSVVAAYALRAPSLLHYTADAAIEQKVAALAERSTTQARDVFDLDLLLRAHQDAIDAPGISPDPLHGAVTRLAELPLGAFQDQVLPFLDPQIAELYQGETSWNQMKSYVAGRLMELA